jgi:hypothetical protein
MSDLNRSIYRKFRWAVLIYFLIFSLLLPTGIMKPKTAEAVEPITIAFAAVKSRGMRKKADADDVIPTIMPTELSSSEARQNWARLIQKIYEVDPLVCPKCQGQMKIISIIDDFEIIDKILKHLNLWDIRNHDPPEVESVYIPELTYVENSDYDNSGSQIPVFDTFWS